MGNMELEAVLRSHAAKYPQMQPVDGVKLIYQNEFGGGHLLRDEIAFLRFLQAEYAATEKDPRAERFEFLGNGILRVQLCALQEEELKPLCTAFRCSALTQKGSLDSFLKKLELLRKLTEKGLFSFDSQALESYLKDYAAAGYPMVSHSQIYREAYHPAYRIIAESYSHLLQESN